MGSVLAICLMFTCCCHPRRSMRRLARIDARAGCEFNKSYKYVADPVKAAERYGDPANLIHGPVFTRPRLVMKVTGVNGRFMSLMLPRVKGEAEATVVQLEALKNRWRVGLNLTMSSGRQTR